VERTPAILDALYPPGNQHFARLEVPGATGVLRAVPVHGHAYFGDLVVGTLVEAFCQPGTERELLQAATDQARALGAGLLVTNQTATELQQGLKRDGWLPYRSNFLVAFSPPLAKRIGEQQVYVNRGDGDGLLNL